MAVVALTAGECPINGVWVLGEVAYGGDPGLERGVVAGACAGAVGSFTTGEQVLSEPDDGRAQRFGYGVDAGTASGVRSGLVLVKCQCQALVVKKSSRARASGGLAWRIFSKVCGCGTGAWVIWVLSPVSIAQPCRGWWRPTR